MHQKYQNNTKTLIIKTLFRKILEKINKLYNVWGDMEFQNL